MNNGILIATSSANVNLNIDQKTLDMCIKTINNFTSTTYQNICNGQSVTLPTGIYDYIMFFTGAGIILFLGVLAAIVWFKVVFD